MCWLRPSRALVALVAVMVALAMNVDARGVTPLRAHVLQPRDVPGLWADEPFEVARSARAWYARCTGKPCLTAIKEMRARGFVVGIRGHLSGVRPGPEALSAAVEFKSTRAAQAMVAATMVDARLNSLITRVPVKGIPGAQAVAIRNAESKGYVIAFASGRFAHQFMYLYPRNTSKPLSVAQALAGARAVYRRIH